MYFSIILLAVPSIKLLFEMFFSNTDYYDSSDYIFILLLISLFTALSNNFGSSFQITYKTKYLFVTTISGALTSIILSMLLVFKFGIYGTLIGRLLGTIVMMLLRAIYANKFTGLKIGWKNNCLYFGLVLIEGIILYQKNLYINLVLIICIILFVYIINREDIKKINFLIIKFITSKKV